MGDVRQVERLLNRSFEIVQTGVEDVTRTGGSDGIEYPIDAQPGSSAFLCFVSNPNASPSRSWNVPLTSFSSGGVAYKKIDAYYDPDVGGIFFAISSFSTDPSKASDETWRFRYYVLKEKT